MVFLGFGGFPRVFLVVFLGLFGGFPRGCLASSSAAA